MKIRLMKSFLILFCLVVCNGAISAQLNISIKNQTIKQIIPQVEKASGYSIFFTNELPDLNIRKNLEVSNSTINQTLNTLFENTDIGYQVKEDKQIILFSRTKAVGQKRTVKGVVSDTAGEPLIGATVSVEGQEQGCITDVDGQYTLEVAENAVLKFSYIGYIEQKINIGSRATVDIVLEEDTKALEEVVVIGYGFVKKKDLTGAVASAKGEDLAARKTTNLSTALQGAVSGLRVVRSNGEPGGTASLRVRGITTMGLKDSGANDPLVIVDGVPGDINQINPNDVESISVLKDAASAAIYGSRAAAGVVLVTTKRAGEGELSLSYTGEFGYEIRTSQPDYVGTQRYLEMTNEIRYNDNPAGGMYQTFPEDQVNNWMKNNLTDPNHYPNTDWRDLILKKSAVRQTHMIHMSGGTKTVRTKASLAYDDVDGLYGDRYYQRYTLRVNNDFRISEKLNATLDFDVKRTKHHSPIFNPLDAMRLIPPIYAALWDDGRIAEGKSGANPYGAVLNGGDEDKWYTRIGGKASLSYKPFAGFNLTGIVAPVFNYNKFKKFRKKATYTLADDPNTVGGYLEGGGTSYSTTKLEEKRNDDYNVTTQLLANYMKTFGAHDLNVMAGYENYYEFFEYLEASRDEYILSSYPYLNNGPTTLRGNSGYANEFAYRSFFGRIMYNYSGKYLFQANIRRDGSSRFAKDHRWGNFPSFSGGWVISEENFMKSLGADWLSYLKLRASWGSLGNERISAGFPYMATIAFGDALFYENGIVTSDGTAAQKEYAVENVTWETTESTDIGLDAAFLKNRLRLTADYYWKKTKDMLLPVQIPIFLGMDNPYVNAGKMSTKGFDLDLGWNDRIGEVQYNISLNLSEYKTKMGDLRGTQFLGDKVKMEGSGFDEWYGYLSDGLFLSEDDLNNSPVINNNTKVGDIKYKDISGPDGVPDGKISPEYDRVLLGDSQPHFLYGGNISASYKGFDLSMAFQGIGRQWVRMEREMVEPLRNNYGNIPQILEGNYWSSFNTDEQNARATYPRLSRTNIESNLAMSDFWLYKGRYLRLKNLTIGYTIPQSITEKVGIKKVRVYASGSDLFCISNYPDGWDPEMEVSAYPITTTVLFGINVNF